MWSRGVNVVGRRGFEEVTTARVDNHRGCFDSSCFKDVIDYLLCAALGRVVVFS